MLNNSIIFISSLAKWGISSLTVQRTTKVEFEENSQGFNNKRRASHGRWESQETLWEGKMNVLFSQYKFSIRNTILNAVNRASWGKKYTIFSLFKTSGCTIFIRMCFCWAYFLIFWTRDAVGSPRKHNSSLSNFDKMIFLKKFLLSTALLLHQIVSAGKYE